MPAPGSWQLHSMDPIRASKRIREHKKDAVQQRKALFRLLVKELRVMSGEAGGVSWPV